MVPPQGGLAHLPIDNAWPVCTTGAFLILCLATYNSPLTCTLPPCSLPPDSPPTLPPALYPLPPNWGNWNSLHREGGNDQYKPFTHYLQHKNKVDFPQYTQSFPTPSAFNHGDLWRSFIVLDRGDLYLLEYLELLEICQQMQMQSIPIIYIFLVSHKCSKTKSENIKTKYLESPNM